MIECRTCPYASELLPKPALILVDADFLAKQFREYQEFFVSVKDELYLSFTKITGTFPDRLDPHHLKWCLSKVGYAQAEKSTLVLFQRNTELDFFNPAPEQVFEIVQSSEPIQLQVAELIRSHSDLEHFLFLGEHGVLDCYEADFNEHYEYSSFLTSYEGAFMKLNDLPSKLSFDMKTPDERLQVVRDHDKCQWRINKALSTIAYVMGFTWCYSSEVMAT